MKIWDIEEAMLKCVDTETGEIIDSEKLENLQMQKEKKIENVVLWIKELEAESDAIAKEVKTLNDRKKVNQNKVESLKKFLILALDGEKFKTSKCAVSYRKSESVDVYDWTLLDGKYLKEQNPVPDKAQLKKDLKSGLLIPGAELLTKESVQIK